MRGFLFPYVVFMQILPDAYAVLQLPRAARGGAPAALLYVHPVCGVLFSVLQLYWGTLLLKQVRKALRPAAPHRD